MLMKVNLMAKHSKVSYPDGILFHNALIWRQKPSGKIDWSKSGHLIASAYLDGTILIWDIEGNIFSRYKFKSSLIYTVRFSPTSKLLGVGHNDGLTVLKVGRNDMVLVHEFSIGSPIGEMKFLNDREIYATDERGRINKFMLGRHKSWELIGSIDSESVGGYSLDMNISGNEFIIANNNSIVKFDTITGKRQNSIEISGGRSIRYSKKFKTCIGGFTDGTIKILSTDTLTQIKTFEGHTATVNHAYYNSDETIILSSSDDDTIRFWNAETGECLASINVVSKDISDNVFSGFALHPSQNIFATFQHISPRKYGITLYQWEPTKILVNKQTKNIQYTSVKVVLVGESNVGKSYLANRIVFGGPPNDGEITSTHGMKFWPLPLDKISKDMILSSEHRREVVLWDMGGQEEYRLIHQMFLHDTTVALILLDPKRGSVAYKEVQTWNKYLTKQLNGRGTIKLLVGAKVDEPSDMIDMQSIKELCNTEGFDEYYETSAINGRGVESLCNSLAKIIRWDLLGETSRPELFQRIRDEIERRQKRGEVILSTIDLINAIRKLEKTNVDISAIDVVTRQLAKQGTIALSSIKTGEQVIVLQVHEIERYAGSLILAARKNPRKVPALELAKILSPQFQFPEINQLDRLENLQEKAVIECTVQLMLQHGICFEYDGLLIFPTLFPPILESSETKLLNPISLYYDFSGAIDNIYASLIAWLVLAKDFGRLRLYPDRAEFEIRDKGLCGLRKVVKEGGFAHVDIYFEDKTSKDLRELFISFVESHVRSQGIEIREQITVVCSNNDCKAIIDELVIKKRIALGKNDVLCSVCEVRTLLASGAHTVREQNPEIDKKTWALKTKIEKEKAKTTAKAINKLTKINTSYSKSKINILHLSDLHFNGTTSSNARALAVIEDIRNGEGWTEKLETLDYIVISGDFTDKGNAFGFEKAIEFLHKIIEEFNITPEQCIIVPGNHDLYDYKEAFEMRESSDGNMIKVQSTLYNQRLKSFADNFHDKFLLKPYPLDTNKQGIVIPFLETGIQFLTFNSCWQIDEFNRKRSGIHIDTITAAVNESRKHDEKRKDEGKPPFIKIAVWHHAVEGNDKIIDTSFIGFLENSGVNIILHGDVHENRRNQNEPWKSKKLYIVGSGTFSGEAKLRPESTPRLYNLISINPENKSVRIFTRQQPMQNGPWEPWYNWKKTKLSNSRVCYYDIKL